MDPGIPQLRTCNGINGAKSPRGVGNKYSEHGLSLSQGREKNILPSHAFLRKFFLPIDTFGPLKNPSSGPAIALTFLFPSWKRRWLHPQPLFPSHPLLLLSHLPSTSTSPQPAKTVSKTSPASKPNSLCSIVTHSHLYETFESATTLFSLSGLDFRSSWFFLLCLPSVPLRQRLSCVNNCVKEHTVKIREAHFLSTEPNYCAI